MPISERFVVGFTLLFITAAIESQQNPRTIFVRSTIGILAAVCVSITASAQMYNVNGHRLYLDCRGRASTLTVVLIAGGGDPTDTWDKVQLPISQFARVCSYDRQGVGRSEALRDGTPQSVAQIVDDLGSLLREAQVR